MTVAESVLTWMFMGVVALFWLLCIALIVLLSPIWVPLAVFGWCVSRVRGLLADPVGGL